MVSIPPGGSIPRGGRRRRSSARRRKPDRSRERPRTIRAWIFQEKPSFKRVRPRLKVRRLHRPEVNVSDTATQIVVIADLPGVKGKDIEVDIHGDIITIEATRTEGPGRAHHYHRELLLPAEVRDVPAALTFDEGLLEVRLELEDAAGEPAKPDAETGKEGESRKRSTTQNGGDEP